MLLKIEGSRLSFARSFATDEVPSEEVDPNAAVVIDEKEASKMRTRIIPVEVSMRYLKSKGKFSTEVIKYVINKEICLKVIQLHMALKQSGWNIGEILKGSLHLKQERLALYIFFFLSKYHPIFFIEAFFICRGRIK